MGCAYPRPTGPTTTARASPALSARMTDAAPAAVPHSLPAGRPAIAFFDLDKTLIGINSAQVWLRAELDLLWQRVRHKSTRPLLRTANPRETLRSLYEARVPLYRLADLVVDSRSDASVENMADRVVTALLARPDVLERK